MKNLPVTKTDIKASLMWGGVLLIILSLVRGTPLNDLYNLALACRDFILSTVVFFEAALDVLSYVMLLALFAALAMTASRVSRAMADRRRQRKMAC